MGKLERARIHVLKNDGSNSTDVESYIEVCFNPKEYSLEKSVEWEGENAFSDAPRPEFKAPKPMSLSVTLQFDTYEERTNVRDKWVRKIEKLTMMTGDAQGRPRRRSRTRRSSGRRPFCSSGAASSSRAWSSRCRRSTRCSSPMVRRCAPSARSRSATCSTRTSTTTKARPSVTPRPRTVQVNANDRLDLIAAKELGDAGRWAEIAALNDIAIRPPWTARKLSRFLRTSLAGRRQQARATTFAVKLGGQDISPGDVHEILVEGDLDRPDHAIITLPNLKTKYSETVTEGDDLEIKLGFVAARSRHPLQGRGGRHRADL